MDLLGQASPRLPTPTYIPLEPASFPAWTLDLSPLGPPLGPWMLEPPTDPTVSLIPGFGVLDSWGFCKDPMRGCLYSAQQGGWHVVSTRLSPEMIIPASMLT